MTKLDLKYSFKEKELGKNFRKMDVERVKKLIDSSTSFSVVGMPAMGISIFLRYLCTTSLAYFIHVDINELSELSVTGFFKLLWKELGNKKKLELLVKKNRRVVLVFNRFDQLQKYFTREFFANLRSIRDIDKEKIVMIFAANRPLVEEVPKALDGGNLTMFSQTYFLAPYSPDELIELIKINSPELLKVENLNRAIELSGGHYQLLQLLLRSEYQGDFFSDPAIELQLAQLYGFLNYREKKWLQKLVLGKNLPKTEEFLLKTGFVNRGRNEVLEPFTPLLAMYIKKNLRVQLPKKEMELFLLLRDKTGRVVTKEEIFATLWPQDSDGATDWALNALVYRLRKNSTFVASGYEIESQKKVGYVLVRA